MLIEGCKTGEKTIGRHMLLAELIWLSVRILFALSVTHNLDTMSIDFVQAFPQAKLDINVFMEFPWGFIPEGFFEGVTSKYVLKLSKYLYMV